MPKAKDPLADKAEALFHQGKKLIEIASQLNIPEGTVRSWKNRYKWANAALQLSFCNVAKRKGGGQPGNKNAVGNCGGGPIGNKKAEKHGFFARYLPSDTLDIIKDLDEKSPLDLLYDQIQLAYAAILRAQRISYVKDHDDITKVTTKEQYSDTGGCTEWEYQQAWDKQNDFMKAQARAQSELRSMLKLYDEMAHKDWDSISEERKARIDSIRAGIESKADRDKPIQITFVKASDKHGRG